MLKASCYYYESDSASQRKENLRKAWVIFSAKDAIVERASLGRGAKKVKLYGECPNFDQY